ncbi:MAG: hypothetical protein VXZ72_03175 [Chlamydiota bacterium]|nr:hypothetical protein [Chlamydiota bacterium]
MKSIYDIPWHRCLTTGFVRCFKTRLQVVQWFVSSTGWPFHMLFLAVMYSNQRGRNFMAESVALTKAAAMTMTDPTKTNLHQGTVIDFGSKAGEA